MPQTPSPISPNGSGAVEVRRVVKKFRSGESDILALKGIDFTARSGELLMITGPSGCGKTTLLSAIAGTLDVDEGEITVFGTSLHSLRGSALTRFRAFNIGFIFQQFHLIPTLNAIENVSIPFLLQGKPRKFAEDKARETLESLGLAGRGRDYPRQFSGGQQQRVAIARALVHSPRLIICDEPTSALDSKTGALIMEILQQAARAPGRCVVVVTHDPRIYRYADRMSEMEDGRVKQVHETPA